MGTLPLHRWRVSREPVARPRSELPDDIALVEVVNRVLDRGVTITGDVVIGVAGVDLVYLGLQLVLSSVETLERLDGVRPLSPTYGIPRQGTAPARRRGAPAAAGSRPSGRPSGGDDPPAGSPNDAGPGGRE